MVCHSMALPLLMLPDRIPSHNYNPHCPGGSELCCYLDREWCAEPAYLRGKGGDKEPTEDKGKPTGLFTRVTRATRSLIRSPQL